MSRASSILLAGLALAASLAAAQPLVVSTNNTPLDRKALEVLSTEALRRAGLEVRFVNHPSERSLQLANQGEIDGEGLKTRLLAIANATIGEGSFKSLKFRDTIQTDDPALNAAAAASEPPQDPEPAAPDAAPAH